MVESVGANVTRWEPGEEVFGWGTGAYAEYAVTDQHQLAVKPDGVTFEQAAGVGVAAFTGLQAMRDVAEVGPGTTVLINGASGGVGTFAVQVAKHLGAEVTGVCSTRNVDLVSSLGADHVIDYTQQDFTTLGTRYDVVLDNVANHPMSVLLRQVVAPRGMLIPNNGTTGGPVIGSIGRMVAAFAWSPFIRQRIRPFLSLQKPEDLKALGEMLEEGTLRAVIDQTFALPDTQAAMRRMATGRVRGKVVITP